MFVDIEPSLFGFRANRTPWKPNERADLGCSDRSSSSTIYRRQAHFTGLTPNKPLFIHVPIFHLEIVMHEISNKWESNTIKNLKGKFED